VTGPTTGLSNPCLDTQSLLCLVMYCSRGGEIGTESLRANYECTLRVSVTGPTTGLSNPCLDTRRLLCLVMYCSGGGEIGTESLRANYDCTLRVSVTVLASSAVQESFDNGLLNVVNWRDRVLSCNLQLNFESICDWPNYWSVQSLPRHPTSSVS
jgi:hypothetical protein